MFQMAHDGHYWILCWHCGFSASSNYRHYIWVQVGADQSLYSGEHPQLNNRKSVCQKKKRKNYGLMCPPNIYGIFNSEGKGVGSPWIVFFFTFYHEYPHVFSSDKGIDRVFYLFFRSKTSSEPSLSQLVTPSFLLLQAVL